MLLLMETYKHRPNNITKQYLAVTKTLSISLSGVYADIFTLFAFLDQSDFLVVAILGVYKGNKKEHLTYQRKFIYDK